MEMFHDALELARDNPDLDLSDAFQLLDLEAGYFSVLVGGSQTRLVTADEALAKAARGRATCLGLLTGARAALGALAQCDD
jgi:hypothetical protein